MARIQVSAPGKLMLLGEHAVVYDRPCLVTAIDQRMRVLVETKTNHLLEINAPDIGVVGYTRKIESLGERTKMPKGVRFLEMLVKNFFETYKLGSGLKVKTESEFSSQFGFGSSSAVTVAALKGLSRLFEVEISRKQLFDLAYKSVLDVQGVGSGFDLAAAIWGGTVYFVTGGKAIIPLKLKRLPLVVGYTGIKADTPTLVRQVAKLRGDHRQLVDALFDNIVFLVQKAKRALEEGDLKMLGQLMDLNQGLLDALGVSTPELSNLVFAARGAGAWGAKLTGAGGGDCMIALANKGNRGKIERAINKGGGKVIRVKTGAEGMRVE